MALTRNSFAISSSFISVYIRRAVFIKLGSDLKKIPNTFFLLHVNRVQIGHISVTVNNEHGYVVQSSNWTFTFTMYECSTLVRCIQYAVSSISFWTESLKSYTSCPYGPIIISLKVRYIAKLWWYSLVHDMYRRTCDICFNEIPLKS